MPDPIHRNAALVERAFGGRTAVPAPLHSLLQPAAARWSPERVAVEMARLMPRGRPAAVSLPEAQMAFRLQYVPYPPAPRLDFCFTRQDVGRRATLATWRPGKMEAFYNDDTLRTHPARVGFASLESLSGETDRRYAAWTRSRYGRKSDRHASGYLSRVLRPYLGGISGDVIDLERRAYPAGTFLEDIFVYRLLEEQGDAAACRTHGIGTLGSVGPQRAELWRPYRLIDCGGYIVSLYFRPEDFEAHRLDLYEFSVAGGPLCERLLYEHFQPLAANEPLQVNDLIMYVGDFEHLALSAADHYGRVVHVGDGVVLVESKWGNLARPYIHPLETVRPDTYGTHYFAARLRGPQEKQAPAGETITLADAGFTLQSGGDPTAEAISAACDRYVPEQRRLFSALSTRHLFYRQF